MHTLSKILKEWLPTLIVTYCNESKLVLRAPIHSRSDWLELFSEIQEATCTSWNLYGSNKRSTKEAEFVIDYTCHLNKLHAFRYQNKKYPSGYKENKGYNIIPKYVLYDVGIQLWKTW